MTANTLGQLAPDEAAQHPQREVAQLAVVAGVGDEAGQGPVERGEGDAGEQQRADRELAVPADDATRTSVVAMPPAKAATGSA